MEKKFWLDCWKEHQIGFHNVEYNRNLLTYFNELKLNPGDHVFVPLCGKSLDMKWLIDQGFQVTGIELSDIAIKEFFEEQNLTYRIEQRNKFIYYHAAQITLIQGDIFDLNSDDIEHIDAIYDRAATIALPIDLRTKYLSKLKDLSDSIDILMIVLDYDQKLVAGPPFAVNEVEVHDQFNKNKITLLEEHKVNNVPPKFKEAKAEIVERVYLIKS